LSKPVSITPGQLLLSGANLLWAEVEGTVTALKKSAHGVVMDVASEGNKLRGMLILVHGSYVTLLTAEGTFDVNIAPEPKESWNNLVGAILRVRPFHREMAWAIFRNACAEWAGPAGSNLRQIAEHPSR